MAVVTEEQARSTAAAVLGGDVLVSGRAAACHRRRGGAPPPSGWSTTSRCGTPKLDPSSTPSWATRRSLWTGERRRPTTRVRLDRSTTTSLSTPTADTPAHSAPPRTRKSEPSLGATRRSRGCAMPRKRVAARLRCGPACSRMTTAASVGDRHDAAGRAGASLAFPGPGRRTASELVYTRGSSVGTPAPATPAAGHCGHGEMAVPIRSTSSVRGWIPSDGCSLRAADVGVGVRVGEYGATVRGVHRSPLRWGSMPDGHGMPASLRAHNAGETVASRGLGEHPPHWPPAARSRAGGYGRCRGPRGVSRCRVGRRGRRALGPLDLLVDVRAQLGEPWQGAGA